MRVRATDVNGDRHCFETNNNVDIESGNMDRIIVSDTNGGEIKIKTCRIGQTIHCCQRFISSILPIKEI